MIAAAMLSVAVMLAAAVAVVLLRSYLAAVAALSVVSLALSVLFALLKAPHVAMAEAAVQALLGPADQPTHQMFPMELVIRDSCGC